MNTVATHRYKGFPKHDITILSTICVYYFDARDKKILCFDTNLL